MIKDKRRLNIHSLTFIEIVEGDAKFLFGQ